MQIHGPSEVVQGIEVTRLTASGSVALSFTGGARLVMQSPADFDDLIRAAVAGKTLFLGEPVADDLLSRSLVGCTDDRAGAVWAVFEPTEGEVAGPYTHRDAAKWAEVNAMSFAGPLTVGRATLDLDEPDGLDAQLSPPAEPGRDTDRPPTGYQLPAARCDGEWSTGAASGRCVGAPHSQGECMDKTGHKFPYRAPVGSDVR